MKSFFKIKMFYSFYLKDYGMFFINVVLFNLLFYEYIVLLWFFKNEVKC